MNPRPRPTSPCSAPSPSSTDSSARGRLLGNPFYVLGLAPECSRAEIERAGQKLLAMLELDLAGAGIYPTPLGQARRDAAKVREAMAELRDPQRRLFHELWVCGAPPATDAAIADEVRPTGFSAALTALGWR
jgi:hypothetical protein